MTVQPALKEWAVVCRSLLAGEQVITLRKGGIHEDGRKFSVPHDRFWLYPTFEHQDLALVKPSYHAALEAEVAARPPGDRIEIKGWAEVDEIRRIDPSSGRALDDLDGHHIWSTTYASERLQWKRREALWMLVLRVHRLDAPVVIQYRTAYGGCSSWPLLEDGMPEPAGGSPALSDAAYKARREIVLAIFAAPAW